MRRVLSAAAVAAITAGLVLSGGAAASAAPAFAPGSSLNNPANAPILIQLGILSGSTATAATGSAAAVAGTGLLGTLGFKTVVGAAVAAAGLMTLRGIEEGLFIETDAGYAPEGPPAGVVGAHSFPIVSGATRATLSVSYAPATGQLTMTATDASGPSCIGGAIGYRTSSGDSAYFSGIAVGGGCASPVTSLSRSVGVLPATGAIGWSPQGQPTPAQLAALATWVSGSPLERGGWVGVDHPAYQPGAPAGYVGTIRTTLTCKPTSGGTTFVEAFAEVNAAPGDDLPVPPAACPAGSVAIYAAVDYRAAGTTTWVGIGSADAPSFIEGLPIDYPDCFNAGIECVVQLWRVGTAGQLASCGPIGEFCPSWAAESVHAPDAYRCSFGPYSIELNYCSVYRAPGVGVLPNASDDTDEEGRPIPLPPTAPVPDPLPNRVQAPDGAPAELPGAASNAQRQCFPEGWGVLNPFEWVVKPLRCVFEPTEGKPQQAGARLQSAITLSSLGVVILLVGGGAELVREFEPSGCQGPYIRIPMSGLGIVDDWAVEGYPLSACEGPAADIAQASRYLGSAMMLWFAGRRSLRNLASIIDYSGRGPV